MELRAQLDHSGDKLHPQAPSGLLEKAAALQTGAQAAYLRLRGITGSLPIIISQAT
jgi:hypothetical protein